ncbi:hypothetical protein K501DRAFT_273442 [Backusella circina FSU 941]|nr:hypothetical protein K501DRAFT_273442 [Backusella circina FSU 941]
MAQFYANKVFHSIFLFSNALDHFNKCRVTSEFCATTLLVKVFLYTFFQSSFLEQSLIQIRTIMILLASVLSVYVNTLDIFQADIPSCPKCEGSQYNHDKDQEYWYHYCSVNNEYCSFLKEQGIIFTEDGTSWTIKCAIYNKVYVTFIIGWCHPSLLIRLAQTEVANARQIFLPFFFVFSNLETMGVFLLFLIEVHEMKPSTTNREELDQKSQEETPPQDMSQENVFLMLPLMFFHQFSLDGYYLGTTVLRTFNGCFGWMPVAALVERRIFCVYGGIYNSSGTIMSVDDELVCSL